MSKKSPSNRRHSSLNVLIIAGVTPYQQKPNEEYMSSHQLLHFKRILKTWKNQLKKDLGYSELCAQDQISINFPDPVDRAVQEEEFNIKLRNRDREHKLIEKIEKTLKKIDTNEFGFCASCDVEIGIRRLEARPTADLCIDCKTLEEIKEKQMTG
ncbi:RNA polymerase-binding protein DksA [Blochmannia endosymbiont of Camponotus sp. C-003]|uniref:RNA polymerase-binding protein DksA n=1 Tax=unclassified Candidatus Blochmanniella TaxID=711328 RepID=UPI0020250722|nr:MULTISPECIES: RNA polymerase-binding protein DksA [unclassified Candidatus Blochmannia]URJ23093.1 RNA polymerase-binding protein DksA [Blochmannia endosymbiont of Camponotus sp. C-003]URJ28560.1 RNA polymerase-binding protein DksA [Blochmannia endosymbiont of Camponotus sp. C-046]